MPAAAHTPGTSAAAALQGPQASDTPSAEQLSLPACMMHMSKRCWVIRPSSQTETADKTCIINTKQCPVHKLAPRPLLSCQYACPYSWSTSRAPVQASLNETQGVVMVLIYPLDDLIEANHLACNWKLHYHA